jgi:hypothetical protein
MASEGEWMFDFSMVVALPLLYGNNVIRNIQLVTTDRDHQINNPFDLLSQNESSPWYGVNHMLCTFHREVIVYQVKNWVSFITNYCESQDEYKLSYKLLIEFMNRPDIFESMGPSYSYILDKYLLITWIKKKDKLLFYKLIFLCNLSNCTSIPSEVDNVKLLPLPQPPVRARTDAWTNPSAQRATQLRSVLARMYAVSIQNQITTTVP